MLEIEIKNKLKQFLKSSEAEILENLAKLIAIKSIFSNSQKKFALGMGVTQAFDFIVLLCKKDNLVYRNFDHYALEIKIGNGKKEIVILHHIDVVDATRKAKWLSDPFILKKSDRTIYGRGVNDNKGPLLYSYYMFKYLSHNEQFLNFLKQHDFQIKLVIGGAEETTWEGIEYYKSHLQREPYYSFSPDGNYPLVFLEKGILKLKLTKKVHNPLNVRIWSQKQWNFICNHIQMNANGFQKTFKSQLVKSRNPIRLQPNNALNNLFTEIKNNSDNNLNALISKIETLFANSFCGEKLGIKASGKYGENTIAITSINLNDNDLEIWIDIRFDNLINKQTIIQKIKNHKFNVLEFEHTSSHFVDPNSFFVQALSSTYQKLSKSISQPTFFSGKSYARAFKKSVAFGVSFPGEKPNSHLPNENQNLDSLILSTQIIAISILSLISGRSTNEV